MRLEPVTRDIWEEYVRSRDPKLREIICEQYADLVRLVAGRMVTSLPVHVDLDELIANGYIGLLHAIDRYEPGLGFKFETYATSRIRGAILDGLRSNDWLPNSVRKRVRELEKHIQQLETELGRPASHAEIAASMGIDEQELDERLQEALKAHVISLNEPWWGSEDKPVEWNEILADPNSDDPFEHAWLNDQRRDLADAIGMLPEKERLIVTLHYYEGLTGAEIARIMDLTPSRISQLHARALLHLRAHLHAY